LVVVGGRQQECFVVDFLSKRSGNDFIIKLAASPSAHSRIAWAFGTIFVSPCDCTPLPPCQIKEEEETKKSY
jgi:hypothetical protein